MDSSAQRFTDLIEWRTEIAARRTDLGDAVIDAAYDKTVDLLLRRLDMGRTRGAVRALANQQLVWTLKSGQRRRRLPDGSPRPGPAGATSLDATMSTGGASSYDYAYAADDTFAEVASRLQLRALLDAAQRSSSSTATVVLHYLAGYGPEEIAPRVGLTSNTVSARKVRFVQRHREDLQW